MAEPDSDIVRWACAALGRDDVVDVRGLRDGGTPWMIRFPDRRVVLRENTPELARTEAVGLTFASANAVAAPELYASDLDRGWLLVAAVDGSSAIPIERPTERLRILGATACAVHAITVDANAGLERRTRPISGVDFDALRAAEPPHPLLARAEQAVRDYEADGADGFVHGDLWQGNAMWDGDRLVALIDWDCAGVGKAGVDLGSLRCDAATAFGPDAADDVLAGWETAAGRSADDLAYWDVVACLSTPTDMGWFFAAIADQGRTDLTRELLVERRDEFLRRALGRL